MRHLSAVLLALAAVFICNAAVTFAVAAPAPPMLEPTEYEDVYDDSMSIQVQGAIVPEGLPPGTVGAPGGDGTPEGGAGGNTGRDTGGSVNPDSSISKTENVEPENPDDLNREPNPVASSLPDTGDHSHVAIFQALLGLSLLLLLLSIRRGRQNDCE